MIAIHEWTFSIGLFVRIIMCPNLYIYVSNMLANAQSCYNSFVIGKFNGKYVTKRHPKQIKMSHEAYKTIKP